ncbi:MULTISPECIES: hypothetical protein [unclassified Neisseria]|uniref:hypothetical protein n=1 Tax=unclassified Neisseria TaxID=2623750 RepID=UPI0010720E4D|nr:MULTISPECIES: hypothetical protein [unclassified Neisseria]MBF0803003.1 hypothetical protein [Neisseria sp. 19428wB4_WF04]TFU44301.1 hypothetical protein E4T99_01235 [Neisseria sp. WF04]TFU99138.1 hypothetical protein E4T85_22165 [Bacillus stratosphericus]
MALQPLPQSLLFLRPLSAQEQQRRAAALACMNSPAKPDCKRNISIGIFIIVVAGRLYRHAFTYLLVNRHTNND